MKKVLKKLFIVFMVLTMVMGMTSLTAFAGERKENLSANVNHAFVPLPFYDVEEDDWYYYDVEFVYLYGLIPGISGNIFAPSLRFTRSNLAYAMWVMAGKPKVSYDGRYSDFDGTDWFYNYAIGWATKYNIIKGYGNGNFGPYDGVTREQFAVMLYRYHVFYKHKTARGLTSLDRFPDKENVSEWARAAMKWAVGNGIITGRNGTMLDPQGITTRAEAAAMLHRYVRYVL